MFNILAVCDDYVIGNIVSVIKRSIDLLGLIVPILLIIGGTINIAKGVLNPEDKNIVKKISTQFVSAIIVFFLPFIINTTMRVITVANNENVKIGMSNGEKTKAFFITDCWVKMGTTDTSAKFYSTTDKDKTTISGKDLPSRKSIRSIYNSIVAKINNKSENTFEKIVLIGDSRFVHQNQYVTSKDGIKYIAESGRGLDYIKEQIGNIKKEDCENCAFVINMGVNDYWKSGIVNEYITYLNNMADTIKGKLYFLSVNPVDEAKEKSSNYPVFTSNDSINKFNQQIKEGLSKKITYLDSNTHLKASGFQTTEEGIHYTQSTSQDIYDYITAYVHVK